MASRRFLFARQSQHQAASFTNVTQLARVASLALYMYSVSEEEKIRVNVLPNSRVIKMQISVASTLTRPCE